MPAPIIPWQSSNIPEEIQSELNRRKINRSFVYTNAAKGGWDESSLVPGDWRQYKGPMSPWVRFCSNSVGKEFEKNLDKNGNRTKLTSDKIKQGFVLFGGKNFYDGYGFNKNLDNTSESIIGYLPDGKRTHVISNDLKTSHYPIHVPSPEIEKISVIIQKELYRKATVEWVCFSKEQLEYMTPYFLIPGISCILEWGWNHFNQASLIDLDNINKLKELNNNPYPLYTDNILNSKGNYDVLFGRISNFEWEVDGNKFKCKTEILSQDRIYAGLVVDSTAIYSGKSESDPDSTDKTDNGDVRPFASLMEFIDKKLPLFKQVGTLPPNTNPAIIEGLTDVINYIKRQYPTNDKDFNFRTNGTIWKDYVYGVFYGRDNETKNQDTGDNKKEDFDRIAPQKETWLNLGLVMEIINYHVQHMKSVGNVAEIFRIDIDDVVISGHPNLISNNGSVMLIPNAMAPKYFGGNYGFSSKSHTVTTIANYNQIKSDFSVLKNASDTIPIKDFKTSKSNGTIADYRLATVCWQPTGALRDNLDELINKIRYQNTSKKDKECAFPFTYPRDVEKNSKPYPSKYSGYLKDLYVNAAFLKTLVSDESIQTYPQLIDKMMSGISDAAGGFWDFRIVSGTGRSQTTSDGIPITTGFSNNSGFIFKYPAATLKIIDYKFMSTANTGTVFSFDYFDSDSLLMGLGFKPTLSNAQAIRTIYAQTNQPDRTVSVVNGDNELLDYKFRDRLTQDDSGKTKNTLPAMAEDTSFRETLRELQQLSPPNGAYQMTMRGSPTRKLITTGRMRGNFQTVPGEIIIRRLALPESSDVLKALLDDGDEENNPKYTGIMPGIQATFTIQGIGGLRTFMMFLVRNLPEPYSHENIIFRIVDVQESIEAGKWVTTITAGIIPLRDNIKVRLGIPVSKTS